MNRGIDAAASGMVANQKWLDIISSNLANANTTGFKSEGVAFGDALERRLRANGGLGEDIGSIGSGAIEQNRFVNWQLGNIVETGNTLDMALTDPNTMFAIQTPGGRAYTRSGSFTLNDQRQLVTREGLAVLDREGNAIELPPGNIRVAADGTVSVDDNPITRVGVFQGNFDRVSGTLFSSRDARVSDDARLHSGAIESSNVNVIENMIGMVQIGRNYEMAQKTIQQQDDLTSRLIQALQQRQ